MSERLLIVPVMLWCKLVRSLYLRGQERRESGAFLLGTRHEERDRVKRFVCYDDLDPRALDAGVVMFDGSGFSRLWKHCRETGLTVLADVHTHPGDHPQQSETDRQNPMICELGHIAVILPRFAATWGWRFRGVGLYEYQGHYRWRRWTGSERKNRVRFSLW